jgi:hypothetical protein
MLKDQIEGKNDSWAIRWHASLFLNNIYCLHPTKAIVKNIGLDNSGIHCETTDLKQEPIDFVDIKPIEIIDSEWFYESYTKSIKQDTSNVLNVWQKLSRYLKR